MNDKEKGNKIGIKSLIPVCCLLILKSCCASITLKKGWRVKIEKYLKNNRNLGHWNMLRLLGLRTMKQKCSSFRFLTIGKFFSNRRKCLKKKDSFLKYIDSLF